MMARFDVCIVPHQRTEFMESLNPIKLWEYLAAGKPIVSTDVAGFRDYPQWVRLANDAPAFVAACRAALGEIGTDEGEKLKRQRRAEAAAHSWTARTAQLLHQWCLLKWHDADKLHQDGEADEREADEREADEREADEREADEREADEREADEREADEREADEREADEREADEREADERDTGGDVAADGAADGVAESGQKDAEKSVAPRA